MRSQLYWVKGKIWMDHQSTTTLTQSSPTASGVINLIPSKYRASVANNNIDSIIIDY